MGFSGAVQWWDEWHLRILVLGSLFIQYFLFFAAVVRRRTLPAWLRLFIWLAYLGGDALAIYALATLFNRHKQLPADGSGLEVLWAPVLLVHLGGQHQMTAYSIEDNELWMRHAITVVSQVTVALYVFCKSWSGEKRLLQAAILLFVVGIIRSSQKPWALKSASISTMVTSFSPSAPREQSRLAFYWQCCTSLFGYKFKRSGRQEAAAEEKDISLQEFVQEARKWVLESQLASDQEKAEQQASNLVDMYVYRLLVDISASYSTRIKILRVLMALDYGHAHHLSELMLRLSFGFLYTRLTMIFSGLGFCLHLLLPFLTLASVILFSIGHKYHGYNATDVKVTYILFSCTALLDFLLLLVGPGIGSIGSVKVSQHSLLSCGFRKKRPTILMKLATVICCKDYVNMHFYIEYAPPASSVHIAQLVHGYVRDGWNEYIHDAASYKRFNSRRGQWTLRRHRHLRWSLNMAFDRSVLLWHIATDLCFQHTIPRIQEFVVLSRSSQECAIRSLAISRYMAYLLCIRPEMLMPGTRNSIFTFACDDVELMLGDESPVDSRIGDLVVNASKLKGELMEMRDEGERWEVVQGVWVEMLCYSAGRCRGYLHAKNLSEGVELLSRVWLLLSFMGMETFADRYQKPEPPETKEEEGGDDDGEGRAVENEINRYQKPGPPETKKEEDEEEGNDDGEGRAVENEINRYQKPGSPEIKEEGDEEEGGDDDGEGRAIMNEINISVV